MNVKKQQKSNWSDSDYRATGMQWAIAALVTGTIIGLAVWTKYASKKATAPGVDDIQFLRTLVGRQIGALTAAEKARAIPALRRLGAVTMADLLAQGRTTMLLPREVQIVEKEKQKLAALGVDFDAKTN